MPCLNTNIPAGPPLFLSQSLVVLIRMVLTTTPI